MIASLVAAAVLTLPQGQFAGKAVCVGADGQKTEYRQTIAISADTIKTTILGDGTTKDEVFVKTAKSTGANGSFSWSGPAVTSGDGYCTASGICHWNLVMHDPNLGDLPGEDTAFVANGALHVVGSVSGQGLSFVCEETYGLGSK